MAQFELAYNKTMIAEGGYSNNPNDPGQETYRGVSRANHPAWPGWEDIDSKKKAGEVMGRLTIFPDLEEKVRAFYKTEFWDHIRADFIPDQGLANMLFDCSVLCGQVFAVKTWQDTLDRVITDTDIDGVFGKQTENNTLQACHSEYFSPAMDIFKFTWLSHLVSIAKKRQSQITFMWGWTLRVMSHC